MIYIENLIDISDSIINLRLQLLINKRLFSINKIPKYLYEKVESNILFKLSKLEDKIKLY